MKNYLTVKLLNLEPIFFSDDTVCNIQNVPEEIVCLSDFLCKYNIIRFHKFYTDSLNLSWHITVLEI